MGADDGTDQPCVGSGSVIDGAAGLADELGTAADPESVDAEVVAPGNGATGEEEIEAVTGTVVGARLAWPPPAAEPVDPSAAPPQRGAIGADGAGLLASQCGPRALNNRCFPNGSAMSATNSSIAEPPVKTIVASRRFRGCSSLVPEAVGAMPELAASKSGSRATTLGRARRRALSSGCGTALPRGPTARSSR